MVGVDRKALLRVVVALTAGCLALAAVIGLGLFLGRPGSPRPATGSGLPDEVWAFTQDHRSTAATRRPLERAVMAYVVPRTDTGVYAVLVSPEGDYYRFPLPGHRLEPADSPEMPLPNVRVELSPDGTKLAWSYLDPHPGGSGIAILDLETGERHDVVLPQTAGVSITQMAWSPNGQWLGWNGDDLEQVGPTFEWFGGPMGGVIAATSDPHVSHAVVTRREWTGASVCDDGSLVPERQTGALPSTCSTSDQLGLGPEVLGRSASGELVTVAASDDLHARTITLDGRVISTLHAQYGMPSVATALIDADHPTNHVTRPDWPLRPSLRARGVAGGVVVLLLAGAGLAWRRIQRVAR